MNFLKNFFARFGTLITVFRIYSRINAAIQDFPGLSCEIKLRAWLLENLGVLSRLALQTTTKIDDIIVLSMTRLIENDTAWKILTRMIHVAEPLIQTEPLPLIENDAEQTQELHFYSHSLDEINASLVEEEPVENPLLILSAVGLLLQILQFLRFRKA